MIYNENDTDIWETSPFRKYIYEKFTLIRESNAFIRESFALIRERFAKVSLFFAKNKIFPLRKWAQRAFVINLNFSDIA